MDRNTNNGAETMTDGTRVKIVVNSDNIRRIAAEHKNWPWLAGQHGTVVAQDTTRPKHHQIAYFIQWDNPSKRTGLEIVTSVLWNDLYQISPDGGHRED